MSPRPLVHHELTHTIIGAFYEVYNNLGFGFLEHIYLTALDRELRDRGLAVSREMSVLVMYKGQPLRRQRLDMLVEGSVIVECKASEELPRIARRQLFNYLRATTLEVGLLLHFGPVPKFYRVVCENLPSQPSV